MAQNNPEKKQFLTRAQRDWKPGMKKKSRSVKVMFASTILVLEAFVAFFGTLAVFGHHFSDPVEIKILIWAGGRSNAHAAARPAEILLGIHRRVGTPSGSARAVGIDSAAYPYRSGRVRRVLVVWPAGGHTVGCRK